MEPKKFLFISWDGLIGDIAWQISKEGHDVKYYIKSLEEREVTDGFVEKVDDWEKEVDWADVIVFDDVLGHGTMAKKLRERGKLVVGGTPYSDKLEDDRTFGQEELKRYGVNIIPYKEFTKFDDAIEYVKQNPARYVIKPSGEAQNFKGLLFIGEEDDGRDVIEVLGDYKRSLSKKIPIFQLQKHITGVEVAVGAFFNGREFVYPINVNFEHKKLFPGNLGPNTGEMGCYDDKTEVLTNNGWKFFKELNSSDEICTLNPINDSIEFHKPTLTLSFNHHKKLISIQNQTLDIAVTPDHNMYVCSQQNARNKNGNFKFVKARDLECQSVIKRTGNWIGIEEKYFVLPSATLGHYEGRQVVLHKTPEIKIGMNDWVAFIGLYLSEGSVSRDSVSISQKEGEKSALMMEILKRLPFKYTQNEKEFRIYNKQLADYFRDFGKSYEKKVPDFIKNLSESQIEIFLKWFCLGDGTIMKNGYRIFYTSSKKLADDVQELLLKIGRVGIIKKRARFGRIWIKDHYANSSREQYEIHERVKKSDSWIDKRDTKIIDYSGRVYCATVKNHIMYVRRNGKPYWCGNTTCFWSGPNKLFNSTLKKMESKLAQEGYVGYIDLNCIVNNNGIYPLEFTARFGYPIIFIQHEGMITPLGEFLFKIANGEDPKLKVKSGFQIGVRIVVPPFPFDDKKTFEIRSKGSVIFFKKPVEGIHIEDVKKVDGQWVVCGSSGVVLVVCSTGSTMRQAIDSVYNKIRYVKIPHMYYRDDIGERWFEDSDKLHNWGYLREV